MKNKISFVVVICLQVSIIASVSLTNRLPAKALTPTGLVAAYGFEEGSGTALNDLSGNLNHGTLTNGPVWVTTGKYGKGLKFDGVNDLVSIPDSNTLDLTTGMTLEAWVYPTSVMAGWDTVIFKGYSTGLVYTIYANGENNFPHTYITSNGTEYGAAGKSRLPTNTWTHLAATYDGAVIRLYVNGVQANTLSYTGAILTSNRALSIGGNIVWADEGFPGIIDEVRIYNRALTASEIALDMQTPVADTPPTSSPSPTRSPSQTSVPVDTLTPTRTSTTLPDTLTPTTNPATGTPFPIPTKTPTITAQPSPTTTYTNTATLAPSPFPTPAYDPTQYVYPIKPSGNGRYFVDQNNSPFFINGDTPWSLIGQISKENAEYYLQDAASKGINSIIVTLTESFYADNAPANFYGDIPFTIPNSFITPNESYFSHADWVINKAANYGIQVIIAPNYLGCCGDGWWDELLNNNTVADAAWYGNYIGNRYKNFPNIMYVWGNDTNPCGYNSAITDCLQREKIRAMAQAAFNADPNHLHTYHATPEFSAFDVFDPISNPWLTTNITYTYQPVQIKILQDYNRTPVSPFFLFESHYESDWANATPIQVRRQAYTAVLSGAAGHHYGNNPIWHMNGKPGDTGDDWKLHLNDEGRGDLPHIRALFESRSWYTLIPDQTHSIVTAGFGAATGSDYVGAALTSDGNTLIAYVPEKKQITVDLTRISGSNLTGWWFDPRTGIAQVIGSFPATSAQNFLPPTNEDWVLVLDNGDLHLPPPGSRLTPTPTSTPSPTWTPAATETLTPSHTPTLTATETPTDEPTPTETVSPSTTPAPTETGTFIPYYTDTLTPGETPTLTATDPVTTPTDMPTSSPTPAPTFTETVPPSFTPSPTNTEMPTPSQTPTPTHTETATPSHTPTLTPTRTPTLSHTPTNTPLPIRETGFNPPSSNTAVTSNAGDNNGYEANPVNVYMDDSNFAMDINSGSNTNTSCANKGKDRHLFYNYDLNIPANAIIKGIEARLDARTDSTTGSPKICIELSWDGGISWTTAKSSTLSTAEATYILGGPSDTWGRAWNYTNFSNANFRVRVIDVASNISRDFYLDYLAINVTYQP